MARTYVGRVSGQNVVGKAGRFRIGMIGKGMDWRKAANGDTVEYILGTDIKAAGTSNVKSRNKVAMVVGFKSGAVRSKAVLSRSAATRRNR